MRAGSGATARRAARVISDYHARKLARSGARDSATWRARLRKSRAAEFRRHNSHWLGPYALVRSAEARTRRRTVVALARTAARSGARGDRGRRQTPPCRHRADSCSSRRCSRGSGRLSDATRSSATCTFSAICRSTSRTTVSKPGCIAATSVSMPMACRRRCGRTAGLFLRGRPDLGQSALRLGVSASRPLSLVGGPRGSAARAFRMAAHRSLPRTRSRVERAGGRADRT